jgi:hypothetical protein
MYNIELRKKILKTRLILGWKCFHKSYIVALWVATPFTLVRGYQQIGTRYIHFRDKCKKIVPIVMREIMTNNSVNAVQWNLKLSLL